MEPFFVIGIIVGLVALLFLWGISSKPLKWIGVTAIKFIAGAVLLVGVNLFGSSLGIHIPVNPVTTGISGILGIPGIAALIVIKRFII
ncbi:pro-sigmaK processing inhibitor BofA family protein [Bacillus sp. ISL-51]|uniref:pro-sigmaK processing inhibitor BofA family protein n=1 Tax=Bacteria TaxID=2 RepID=UPI001BE7E5AA|nr:MULTISPECIES: pro-sigmaK processing inhibitor BofA family protein [Bacteria]MBT2575766.1 pro-sigmaK processing inhibitor BofA family protein [Bacillus sp. ISL-51]MBT2635915.1 pro-sigmaK processing inhibitor BofA family protein [Bacillus sp. ISL-26]MBT2714321.1 pro-sigmaK processing inhibitor BofA family protein [Pseudomonas sp. ISL-88]MBY8914906.1 pro-sigmaK processing inhibitor BofA family protein [Bacillus sp. YC2]